MYFSTLVSLLAFVASSSYAAPISVQYFGFVGAVRSPYGTVCKADVCEYSECCIYLDNVQQPIPQQQIKVT
eukprot:Awhi_evm1s5006